MNGTVLIQKTAYDNNGVQSMAWWGQQEPFYPGSSVRGMSFIPAKKLRGQTGTPIYAIRNRALGVKLDTDEQFLATSLDTIGF